MKRFGSFLALASLIVVFVFAHSFAKGGNAPEGAGAGAEKAPVSPATAECLGCHESVHPGIVADWEKSRHARTTPKTALAETEMRRRFSAKSAPEGTGDFSVGCAECHTQNPSSHKDTVSHNGYEIHPVVTPSDCAACHPEEKAQFGENIMAKAVKNLGENPVYAELVKAGSGPSRTKDGRLYFDAPEKQSSDGGCFSCHGTKVTVTGLETRDTDLGEMEFPRLSGWPNQGVGRVNPDGSEGSCAACHPRHRFSTESARSPKTCGQCHTGPDVPAYKVYTASKHGNIFDATGKNWNMDAVPWVVGRDFSAPTCASCHVSLVTDRDGTVIAKRSHRMNDRLEYRLFGVIYGHRHPVSPDTTIIRNADGLPLACDFEGRPATNFLISEKEAKTRRKSMSSVCGACHATGWTAGHFDRLDATVAETNAATLAATGIMRQAWEKGICRGLAQKSNPFDEPLERKWTRIWLFYANSTRFAAAMAGGGDYGVFADGRFQLNEALSGMAASIRETGEKPQAAGKKP